MMVFYPSTPHHRRQNLTPLIIYLSLPICATRFPPLEASLLSGRWYGCQGNTLIDHRFRGDGKKSTWLLKVTGYSEIYPLPPASCVCVCVCFIECVWECAVTFGNSPTVFRARPVGLIKHTIHIRVRNMYVCLLVLGRYPATLYTSRVYAWMMPARLWRTKCEAKMKNCVDLCCRHKAPYSTCRTEPDVCNPPVVPDAIQSGRSCMLSVRV